MASSRMTISGYAIMLFQSTPHAEAATPYLGYTQSMQMSRGKCTKLRFLRPREARGRGNITRKEVITVPKPKKSVSIQRAAYSMALEDGEIAEITMYGEIVEERPFDWWTGKEVEGDYIVQSEFLRDLEAVAAAKSVTIRMNSLGGDAGVSILIHNRLRELAAKGVALTCVVDGVAMSGGSLIMCACDTVQVNPSSLIMIHKCWSSLYGCYNADELREAAVSCDAWDKAQVSIYKRKTGLSDPVISHMMGATTYMTGQEAVDKGFADEVIEDAEPLDIAASADGRSLVVNGRTFHFAPGMFAPDSIPTVKPGGDPPVETNTPKPGVPGSEGGNKPMAKTIEELRAEYPEQIAQLEAEAKAAGNPDDAVKAGVQAEQKRIQEIDALAVLYDEETVQAAKYGENACTAQEMAYRAAQKAAQEGKKRMADLEADTETSGVQKVKAASDPNGPGITLVQVPEEDMTPEQRMAAARVEVKALFRKEEE